MATPMRTAGVVLVLALTTAGTEVVVGQCSKDNYQYCVKLADPLLKDPHLIFPDNLPDIERVCRTWSLFVDCVKKYTDLCFSEKSKNEFNKAVENPVDSIHQLCTSKEYQTEYLKHASCMKATLTQDKHCGRHYRHLVSQVSGEAGRNSICCSHHRFRECVLDQTSSTCEPDAGPFSRQILDKALSFLRDQCHTYNPQPSDCPGSDFYSQSVQPVAVTMIGNSRTINDYTRPMAGSSATQGLTTASPDMPPWNTDSRSGSTSETTNWSPSWVPGHGRTSEVTVTSETIAELSNTRSSFGRGMSWPSTGPSTWKVSGGLQTASPWYPSSRPSDQMMKDNAIDEPNQQGLGSKNAAVKRQSYLVIPLVLAFLFTLLRR